MNDFFEIERRYLIRYPDMNFLHDNASATEIVQTYLLSDEEWDTRRVRKRGYENKFSYTYTRKKCLSSLTRLEDEVEIEEKEYNSLLIDADPVRKTIKKTRFCLEYCGKVFEIDMFSFWNDRAIMEVELESETECFSIPPQLEIIREISSDGRYTNSSLAKEVPFEPIV